MLVTLFGYVKPLATQDQDSGMLRPQEAVASLQHRLDHRPEMKRSQETELNDQKDKVYSGITVVSETLELLMLTWFFLLSHCEAFDFLENNSWILKKINPVKGTECLQYGADRNNKKTDLVNMNVVSYSHVQRPNRICYEIHIS